MWCPNCKNEYVPGITHCADCGAELVDALELSDMSSDFSDEFLSETTDAEELPEEESGHTAPLHAYVSKREKAADIKSTAYTFTVIGLLGMIFLALFMMDVLPFAAEFHTKILTSVVMGIMFLIFLMIGIRSFLEIKAITRAADEEDALFHEITAWFQTAYSKELFDSTISAEDENQLYFSRYERMQQYILEKYPDLEDTFLDHIIESLYTEWFSS